MKRKPKELIFNMAALRPLLEHTRSATAWRPTLYGDDAEPGLWLVHDDGIYLMSNGDPGLMRPDNEQYHQVVYAQGLSPADPEWWVAARAAVGGDDFAMLVPIQMFNILEDAGYQLAVFRFWGETLNYGGRDAEEEG